MAGQDAVRALVTLPSSIGTYIADTLRRLDHGRVTLIVADHRIVAVDTQHQVRWQLRSTGVTA